MDKWQPFLYLVKDVKRQRMVIKFVVAVLLCFNVSCNSKTGYLKTTRPTNVPENAFWRGGADGGNWYLVHYINDHRNAAKISIYNDQDGSLIVTKTFFKACPTSQLELIKNLPDEKAGFDGDKILLNSRCTLLPQR